MKKKLHNTFLPQIINTNKMADTTYEVPILGLYQEKTNASGRIVIYGDSNCIDASHLEKPCYWMLAAILEYTSTGHMPKIFNENNIKDRSTVTITHRPERMDNTRLYLYSKVLEPNLGAGHRAMPSCPRLTWAQPNPLNVSAPNNLYKSQKLLTVIEDTKNLENNIKGD